MKLNITIDKLRNNYKTGHRKPWHYAATYLVVTKSRDTIMMINKYCSKKRRYLMLILDTPEKYNNVFVVGSSSTDKYNTELITAILDTFKKIGIHISNSYKLRYYGYDDNIKILLLSIAEELGYNKDDLLFIKTSA